MKVGNEIVQIPVSCNFFFFFLFFVTFDSILFEFEFALVDSPSRMYPPRFASKFLPRELKFAVVVMSRHHDA